MRLIYFAQRGRFAGHWRYVPFAALVPNLRSRLLARGYILTEVSE